MADDVERSLALDEGAVRSWLTTHVGAIHGRLRIERIEGGQSNPTYKILAGSDAYVLRRKPPGVLLPSAHAVEREFRVLKALATAGLPVPRVRALCEDTSVIGSVFYVMDFVDGRIFWNQLMPEVGASERRALFDSMNETIARLHQVEPAVVGLTDYGRPGNYMARQLDRWTKQYRAAVTEPIPEMEWLSDWLASRVPVAGDVRVVHGDFKIDNVMFHVSEPRVVAVLDWELSTLGDPLADFAYHAMAWRLAPDLFRGLGGIDYRTLGIPTEEAYVAAYCRRTGRASIANWLFYIVFSMFKLAAILQGVLKRAIDGSAASVQALEIGRRARPVAEHAWATAAAPGD